jgi:N12 class adenine-specific DNA methylase
MSPSIIQRIADAPWIFAGMVVCLVILNVAATIRVRHERKLATRVQVDRRRQPRTSPDRRWSVERLKK